jgi:hypothetical protein
VWKSKEEGEWGLHPLILGYSGCLSRIASAARFQFVEIPIKKILVKSVAISPIIA